MAVTLTVSDYKYLFLNPPPDDVICPLCLDIVEEPHHFTCCGQYICNKIWRQTAGYYSILSNVPT